MHTTPAIESKLAALPARPGVYILKDAAGEPIYVGKAKSLRDRVRSYFRDDPSAHHKPVEMRRRSTTRTVPTFRLMQLDRVATTRAMFMK